MNLLKQSTAVDIPLGPFVDETDGKTAETGLTISQADVRLKKGAGNWAQKNEATSASHEEAGWYEVPLDTTDTNTLGHLIVAVHESGALPVWREFLVVPANIYDSLVSGSDTLDVAVTSVASSVITRAALSADTGLQSARSNTAQAGASSSITLDASASATTDFYKGMWVILTGGTGAGQARQITAYNGTTKVATVLSAWATNPDNTSTFAIMPLGLTFHEAHETALTESYATDGAAPTVAQALLLIQQLLTEISVSGTTMTVKKLDGSTTAATLTLNDASSPTSVTRAT